MTTLGAKTEMKQDTQKHFIVESSIPDDKDGVCRMSEVESEHLNEEIDAERDKYLRLAAEYKNYRRRTELEREEAADSGKRELLNQLLSLADDLDRALAGANEFPQAVADGLQMIRRRFHDTLEANSIIAFESLGEKFDPERHEAFAVAATGEHESGTVHEEIRRGYFWRDRLFRPALVVVEQ
jgi:molecular chaperone GrpE